MTSNRHNCFVIHIATIGTVHLGVLHFYLRSDNLMELRGVCCKSKSCHHAGSKPWTRIIFAKMFIWLAGWENISHRRIKMSPKIPIQWKISRACLATPTSNDQNSLEIPLFNKFERWIGQKNDWQRCKKWVDLASWIQAGITYDKCGITVRVMRQSYGRSAR